MNIYLNKSFAAIALTTSLLSTNVYASTENDAYIDELMELGIEDLMNVTITTASKRAEKIYDAPGIISVLTADDIARYGSVSLVDVLNKFPSVNVNRSFINAENITSIRSQTLGFYDVHTLVLLNGRPMRDSASGGLNNGVYRSFPVEAIDRVELIRGPGSVLYGANAYSGVVNIITKNVEKQHGEYLVSTRLGNMSTNDLTITGGQTYKDFHAYGALRTHETDDIEYKFTDERGISDSPSLERNDYSGFLDLKYKKFSFMGLVSHSDYNHLSPVPYFPYVNGELATAIYDLGFESKISGFENWNIKSNLTYNTQRWRLGHALAQGLRIPSAGKDILFETTLSGKINDKTNVLFGGTTEHQDGQSITAFYHSRRYNFYFQTDYKITDDLKIITGAQYNKIIGIDGNIVPRIAAIYNFNEHNGIKLQYGEAFRSPYGVETDIRFSTIVGNGNLEPEEIATYDVQLFRHTPQYNISVNAFHSRLSGIIERQPQGSGLPLKYQNGGIIYSQGLELEGKAYLNKNWSIIGSATYQISENLAGDKDVLVDPDAVFKIGISYESDNGVVASIFNTHGGEGTKLSNQYGTVNDYNPQADDHDLLSATLKFNVGKTFDKEKLENIDITFQGDNLLNEEVYTPEISRKIVNTLPQKIGRFISAKVTMRF